MKQTILLPTMLLCLGLLAASCSDDRRPVKDAEGVSPPADGRLPDRALSPDAAVDAGTPPCETRPAGFCEPELAVACLAGDDLCQCIQVCSGVQPRPGEEYSWSCETPDQRCPPTAPSQGSACSFEELTCIYGTCGGVKATCTDGAWQLKDLPLPP